MNTKGVAGWVFSHKEGAIIHDAYKDDRFDKSVDMRTGYRTKSILCAPLKTVGGEMIGVSQILNKIVGKFNEDDLEILEAMTKQAAIAIFELGFPPLSGSRQECDEALILSNLTSIAENIEKQKGYA